MAGSLIRCEPHGPGLHMNRTLYKVFSWELENNLLTSHVEGKDTIQITMRSGVVAEEQGNAPVSATSSTTFPLDSPTA